jgi:tetratricopeptide (TPR) repeat protein
MRRVWRRASPACSSCCRVEAISYYQQALAIGREIGDRRGEGNALGNLGLGFYTLGQVKKAIKYYEQALAISREISDRRTEGTDLANLGLAHESLGDVEQARQLWLDALASFEAIQSPRVAWVRGWLEGLEG